MSDFLPEFDWERQVPCYCGYTKVVTRRPPAYDRYSVCSFSCWQKMVNEGNEEPGSLLRNHD